MSKKLMKILSLCIACLMIVAAAAGCGNSSSSPSGTPSAGNTGNSTANNSADSGSSTDAASNGTVTYPINTNEKLTYWVELNPSLVAPNFTNLGDTEFAKQLEKETGVKVEYIHPTVGMGTQSFNLLVASGNMPDIIDYGWSKSVGGYPGGPEAAINNKIIIPLNSYLEKDAPDLKKILDENPDYDKMVKSDSGNYYIFPVMKLDDYLNTTYGLCIRTDWLKDLGLAMPETIDDWYNVLKAFKDKKGATAPFSYAGAGNAFYPFENGVFIGAFGVNKGLYLDNGEVKFGPYEPGYKDWLVTMNKWFQEGLIDNNFATNDQKAMDSNILTGKTGVFGTWAGSGLSKYMPGTQENDPNATFSAVRYPVLNKGDKPQFNSLLNPFDGAGACITTSCRNPSLAAQFLNYGYTEKGRLTYNYGIEGVSYTMENGLPFMTDEVLKNPDGLPIGQAWSKYSRGVYPGPYFSEKRFLELYYVYQEQKDALGIWTDNDMKKHLMPPVSPTPEESSEYARIINEVNSFVDEFTLKAIMGTEDLSNFDQYIKQLEKLNIKRALEIQQAALDRYNNR